MPGYQPRIGEPVYWVEDDDGALALDLHSFDKATGLGLKIEALRGWDDRVDIRDVRELRHARDGEHADNVFLGGRTITIEGTVFGDGWKDLQARKRELVAAFIPSSTEKFLKVPDPAIYLDSYEAHVLDTVPVAYFPLDEAAGASSADNRMTPFSAATVNGNPVFGVEGGAPDGTTALDLDGTGDYLERAYSATFNPSAFTVAAWVRRDVDSGATEFVVTSSDNTNNRGWRMFIDSSDKLTFAVGNGTSISGSVSTTSITAGTWFFVVGTYDGTNTAVYVNGTAEDTDAKAYTANSTNALRIGARDGSTSNLFNGRVQHVAIWDRALHQNLIYQLHRYGENAFHDGNNGNIGYEHARARVIEALVFGDLHGPDVQSYQVILRASDPRIYGDVPRTDTDATTTLSTTRAPDLAPTHLDGGTYETPAALTVTGPTGSAWTIQQSTSGLYLAMSGLALVAGETVDIDTLEQTIEYNATYERVRTTRDELVALWMLDESAGTTADNEEGTAGYDGTYTGGYTLNQSGPVSGLASVDLNGSTGYVAVPFNAALFPTQRWIFEGWVNFDSLAATKCIIDGITSNRGWRLEWDGSTFQISFGTGAAVKQPGNSGIPNLSTGTWYHLAVALDATSGANLDLAMYLNGELLGMHDQFPQGAYSAATSGGYRFGGRLDGSNDFDGKISAFALYDLGTSDPSVMAAELYSLAADPVAINAYQYLDARSARWNHLPDANAAVLLSSSGLSSGSALTITARRARV